MTAGARVAGFAALLAAIFVLAAIAGRAAGPTTVGGGVDRDHASGAQRHESTAPPASAGLRLVAARTTLTPGRAQRFTFEIRDDDAGRRVRDFDVEQGRRMHLVVVRRDLRRFQHLHPRQDSGGRWSISLTLPDAGVYHAFADFRTAGERQTLGVDLFAAGDFDPLALPVSSNRAATDGYDVSLRDDGGTLRFTVGRAGKLLTGLQPYLGAAGHLVMLRAGDLAYQHVHPVNADTLDFATDDAPGTYRLFLQFRHGDRVHTAAFTHEVAR